MITVNVTQEDIDYGTKSSCIGCPVARALTRTVGKGVLARHVAFFVIDDTSKWGKLPSEAIMFIRQFDNGGKVTPFEFQVELVDYSIRPLVDTHA